MSCYLNMKSFGILFMLAGTVFMSSAFAQDEAVNDLAEEDRKKSDRNKIVLLKERVVKDEVKGVVVGDFTVSPVISVTEYYDDNLYATESDTQDDFVTVITPAVNITSNWKAHSLKVAAGADFSRYAEFSTENTNDYWVNLAGRFDLDRKKNIFGGLSYERNHEDRASPEAVVGEEPVEYDLYSGNAGYSAWHGNHQVKFAYTYTEYDFMSVPSLGSVILNDDRDRTEQGIGIRYLYRYSKTMAPFIQASVEEVDYLFTPDYEGYDRNSQGARFNVGLNVLSKNTNTRLFAGSVERDYDNPLFDKVSEVDFGLNHVWKISDNSQFRANLSRSILETTFPGSPGYLSTDGSLQWRYKINDKNSLRATYARLDADYYDIDRNDTYENYVIGYSRTIVDDLVFSLDLQKGTRDSSVSGDDYTINQVYFRINAAI